MTTSSRALLLASLTLSAVPCQAEPDRIEYREPGVTVVFDRGAMGEPEMATFARLVDAGIRDIREHLARNAAGVRLSDGAPTFVVTRRARISRAYQRTVLLPLQRVRDRRAPYLHEAAHVLVPALNREVWLNEGFASYIESYIAENVGGYAGNVFSSAGNAGIDRDARRHLRSHYGQTALEFVGRLGTPPGFYRDRERVARPLYVLAQSFFKFLVEKRGLGPAVQLLDAPASARAIEASSGRSMESWKQEWLVSLGEPLRSAEITGSGSRE
jgi:hypothetical protein